MEYKIKLHEYGRLFVRESRLFNLAVIRHLALITHDCQMTGCPVIAMVTRLRAVTRRSRLLETDRDRVRIHPAVNSLYF